jgi:F-type H+-transporting ATPase subunit b
VSSSLATFLFETANFLLLVGVLGWVFFRPVRGALERRRDALAGEREEAARLRRQAEAGVAELGERRQELEASLAALGERARAEAEREAERIVAEARERMQRERDRLETELVALRREQARAATADVATTAGTVLERLLARIDGPELASALTRAACRELQSRTPEARGEALGEVVVESASPLDETSRRELEETLGLRADRIRCRVVPELVAGTRLVTSVGLADASAAAVARRVTEELVRRIESEEAPRG